MTTKAAYGGVLDALGPLHGRRFLDVGCGTGLVLRLAADRGATVWGLDRAPGLLRRARARVPGADLRVGDLDELPFDSRSFDIVCRSGRAVPGEAEQVEQAELAGLGELIRVCRPGGTMIVTGTPGALGALARLGVTPATRRAAVVVATVPLR